MQEHEPGVLPPRGRGLGDQIGWQIEMEIGSLHRALLDNGVGNGTGQQVWGV
jgi:hypothetical protein